MPAGGWATSRVRPRPSRWPCQWRAAEAKIGPLRKGPEYDDFSAAFNLDGGSGRIRGVFTGGNPALAELYRGWIAPLKDLGVMAVYDGPHWPADQSTFTEIGLPGISFLRDALDYDSRAHHTQLDTLERLSPDDLAQASHRPGDLPDQQRQRRRAGAQGRLAQQAPRGGRDVGLAHQAFADQHGLGAGRFHAHHVVGDEQAALGDQQGVLRGLGGQAFGDGQVDDEALEVAVVDADQGRAQLPARSISASSCTSTRASMPSRAASAIRSAARASSIIARITRMASAPRARLSATCQGSTRKSLRMQGRATAARASIRKPSAPWKLGPSVSTDRHDAPPAA